MNEEKFYESDINFVVMVKVMSNKIELNQEILAFNKIEPLTTDDQAFIRHYGDAFVSGFIEGGGEAPSGTISLSRYLMIASEHYRTSSNY